MNLSIALATFIVFCIFSLSFASEQKTAKTLARKNSRENINLPTGHGPIEDKKASECPFLRNLKDQERRAKATESEKKK